MSEATKGLDVAAEVPDLRLKKLDFGGGKMRLTFENNPALTVVASSLIEMLDGQEAVNYVEMLLGDPKGEMVTLTVQRTLRPTPHELRRTAEAERDVLRWRVRELGTAALALRAAQRAYMADRGNEEKGRAVAAAASALDAVLAPSTSPEATRYE